MATPETVVIGNVEELLPDPEENLPTYDRPRDNIFFRKCGVSTALVGLKYPCALYFEGILEVNVICGKLLVNGFCAKSDDRRLPFRLFSLTERSASCLSTCVDSDLSTVELGRFHDQFASLAKDLLECIGSVGCIICVSSRMDDYAHWKTCLEHHQIDLFPNITRAEGIPLFTDAEKLLKSVLDVKNGFRIPKKLVVSEELQNLTDELISAFASHEGDRSFTTVVCGGKGVGKSTYLSYLVNRFLCRTPSVLYIDLDIGQPEFSLSGCISALVIDNPIFGPNYSHLKEPLISYYVGDVNPVQCLNSYLLALSELFQFCSSNEECKKRPWFINTMGMTKGLGLDFIAATLSYYQPHHLVQIDSSNQKDNFSVALDSYFFRRFSPNFTIQSLENLDYAFHSVSSVIKSIPRSVPMLSASKLREALFAVYLSPILASEDIDKWSRSLNEDLINEASNEGLIFGDVVALCRKSGMSNICLGFGIASDIKDSRILAISSPLGTLNDVNRIMKAPVNFKANVVLKYFKNRAGVVPNMSSFDVNRLNPEKRDLLKALFGFD